MKEDFLDLTKSDHECSQLIFNYKQKAKFTMAMKTINKLLNGFSMFSASQKDNLEEFLYDINHQIENSAEWKNLQFFLNEVPVFSDNFDDFKYKTICHEIIDVKGRVFSKCAVGYECLLVSETQILEKADMDQVIRTVMAWGINRLLEIKVSIDDPNIELVIEDLRYSRKITLSEMFAQSKDDYGFDALFSESLLLDDCDENTDIINSEISESINPISCVENKNDLPGLELDELVACFESIGNQAQLLQGLILLELRSRYPSTKEFGNWISNSTLCAVTTHQQRTRLMNFATFFRDRDMAGISITAAYEISAPKNADVADQVYNDVHGKNLSVADVVNKIKAFREEKTRADAIGTLDMSIPETEEISETEAELMPEVDRDELKRQLFLIVAPVPVNVMKEIFRDCLSDLKKTK